MPMFLSKVFGRKKYDDSGDDIRGRPSDASLLEGKFEAVSPTVSPTAANFLELFGKDKEKEKDGFLGLSRARSGPASSNRSLGRLDELPHLTLNLPGPKDDANARALGVVFEADPESRIVLSDSEIGDKRLNPLETLILVKACSQAITQRGTFYSPSPQCFANTHPHRTRNSRNHAPSLVFRLSKHPAQTYFLVYTIFVSKGANHHVLSNSNCTSLGLRIRTQFHSFSSRHSCSFALGFASSQIGWQLLWKRVRRMGLVHQVFTRRAAGFIPTESLLGETRTRIGPCPPRTLIVHSRNFFLFSGPFGGEQHFWQQALQVPRSMAVNRAAIWFQR